MQTERLTIALTDGRNVEVLALGPPGGLPLVVHHGTPAGGGRLPSTSAFNMNTPPSITTHCSVAGRPLSILLRSAMQSCFCVITSGSRLSLVLEGL